MKLHPWFIATLTSSLLGLPSLSVADPCVLERLQVQRAEILDALVNRIENLDRIPKFKRLIQGKAIGRWRRSADPGWQTLHDLITTCVAGQEVPITLHARSFELLGSVRTDEHSIEVTLKNFKAKDLERSRTTPYGIRPTGLNASFSNFLGAVLDGVADSIAAHPGITQIRIRGAGVVSPHLAEILKDLGFHSPPVTLGEIGTASLFRLLSGWARLDARIRGVEFVNRMSHQNPIPKDWTLELNLVVATQR